MLKYLVEKYRSIKSEYMNRSPKGKWRFVLNSAIFFQRLIAVEQCDVNFEVWWYTYASGVAFLDLVFSFVYTLWYYADQPLKGLLSISLIGIIVPVTETIF